MAQPKEEWLQAIATKAKVEVSKVEGVLSAHQIQPSPLVAQPRRLVLRDIEFSGEKDGVADAGDFSFSWTDLDHGLWAMLSEHNLRGKSTIIEIVRWMIRGRPTSNLQEDVRRWVNAVRLSFSLMQTNMRSLPRLRASLSEAYTASVMAAPKRANQREPCLPTSRPRASSKR